MARYLDSLLGLPDLNGDLTQWFALIQEKKQFDASNFLINQTLCTSVLAHHWWKHTLARATRVLNPKLGACGRNNADIPNLVSAQWANSNCCMSCDIGFPFVFFRANLRRTPFTEFTLANHKFLRISRHLLQVEHMPWHDTSWCKGERCGCITYLLQ